MNQHFGEFVRWKKARVGLNNVALARLLGCDTKTVTNLLRYKTPDKLGDVRLSRLAAALKYSSEAEFLAEWKRGLPPLNPDDLVVDDQPDPRRDGHDAPAITPRSRSGRDSGRKANAPRRSTLRPR